MENTLYVALSAQISLRRRLDATANNIANLNTPAFQGDRVRFKELITLPRGTDDITFNTSGNLGRDRLQGPITDTRNPLDFALRDKQTYFTVQNAEGERYTRNGRFTLNEQNQIATAEGNLLLDVAGNPITVPTGYRELTLSRDGVISVDGNFVTQLGIVEFEDDSALEKIGTSFFTTDQTPIQTATPFVEQYALEGSNVKGVTEIVSMIDIQHFYQTMQSQVVKGDEDRMGEYINTMTQINNS
ncbi:MAG: flagellar hook-basal body protein [Alphaproteobacteria bacterium]|nr:flagellar hook-basal body protein [Alphaproteobacteria bacterium]